MNESELPKGVKRLLREQVARAHEEELRRALLPLAAAFEDWKAAKLSSGELSDRIQEFHQGPARNLFVKYDSRNLRLVVAHAIVTGVLDEKSIAPELREALQSALEFYRSQG